MNDVNMPIVSIENVSRTFNIPGREPVKALQNVSNHVDKGEVLVLIGPSGSGKSTLLRTLNGLETIDSGRIVIDGVGINDPKTDLNKVRERVGMVFQHFNLFQHKTALENVTLPQVVVLKRSRAEAAEKADQLLERIWPSLSVSGRLAAMLGVVCPAVLSQFSWRCAACVAMEFTGCGAIIRWCT